MARIRTIKPEFWRHEDLSALPEATHMLAAQLLNYADDYGYFNANPALIKAEISPIREPSVSIPESLRSLQTIGYLMLGVGVGGRHYGRVVNFEAHQKVSHPTPSKISMLSIDWIDSGNSPEILRSPQDIFAPEQGTGNREQGRDIVDSENEIDEPPSLEKKEISDAIKLYNDMAAAMGLAVVFKVTPARRAAVRRRLKDCGGLSGWRAALVKLSKSPFCCGENDRGWRADLDFLCQQKSFVKLMEGAYDHSAPKPRFSNGGCPI